MRKKQLLHDTALPKTMLHNALRSGAAERVLDVVSPQTHLYFNVNLSVIKLRVVLCYLNCSLDIAIFSSTNSPSIHRT